MLYKELEIRLKEEEKSFKKRCGFLDVKKVNEVNNLAEKLGIEKMVYEHPGHIDWKRRWEDAPTQRFQY